MQFLRYVAFPITLLAVSPLAVAGGFTTARFGAEDGHAATDHPTSIYYNPAGLALSHGTHVYLEGLLAYRSAEYQRPVEAIDNLRQGPTGAGTPEAAVTANSGKARLQNVLASPFFAVTSDLGVEHLGVGFGVYVPFGGQASWDENDEYRGSEAFPGAVSGVQRWSVIEGSQRALYVTLAGSYEIPGSGVSIGAGLNLVRQEIESIRARTGSATDDLVTAVGSVAEGRSLLDVADTTLAASIGVIYQPLPVLRFGLSYQSQPGFGKTTLEGTLTNRFGTAGPQPLDVELEQSLPDIARFAATWRPIPAAEVRLAGDYQRWSTYERQCILDRTMPDRACELTATGGLDEEAGGASVLVSLPRDWHDTFGVRLGGSYWVVPAVELFGSASFDSNAVPDETLEPALIDSNKGIFQGGATFRVSRMVSLKAALAYVLYADRETSPRPRGEDGEPLIERPSRNPDGAGRYEQSLFFLTLGAMASF